MIRAIAVAAMLSVFSLVALGTGAAVSEPSAIRSFSAEPAAWPVGTWEGFKAKYLQPEGRIIDDANGNISHSEGQGYGMLLAVIANDQAAFSRIWAWTRKELMIRPDGLAAWRWEPDKTPNVTDKNNASDGDLLIAWALAEAAERWHKPEWATEAGRIARTVDKLNGARSPFGRVLMPGEYGFGPNDQPDGPVVNLSYWLFPAFDSLRKVAPNVDWDGYKASGLTLLRAARFGAAALPTDWISIADGKAVPATGFPPTFSYNAIRIPLYLAWGGNGTAEHFRPFISFSRNSGENLREYNVKTSENTESFVDRGYQAVFALSACAAEGTQIPLGLRSVSFDRYYSSTLHMLALAAARLRYSKCW